MFLVFFLDVEDLLAVVVTALGANAMGTDHFTALGASDEAGDFKFEVGTAKSFTGFRDSSLWDCHGNTSFGDRRNYRRTPFRCKEKVETMSKIIRISPMLS